MSIQCPQVDYGQGSGVWNPATRGPVYNAMERARWDKPFGLLFAMDILFGKEATGNFIYYWVREEIWETDAQGEFVLDENGEKILAGYRWAYATDKFRGNGGSGWLYNSNTLNAARSWVALMFGPPATCIDGVWRIVHPCCPLFEWVRPVDDPVRGNFTFVPGGNLRNTEIIRLLNEGHWAFETTDAAGVRVCVPWSPDLRSAPMKLGRGRPEAENSKRIPRGRYYRDPF